MPQATVIYLEAGAPAKPPTGAPCNGCGACCALEPCPLGQWITRRRRGRCAALDWDAPAARYRCGVVAEPRRHVTWLPAAWTRALALRWIAAGRGCDASLELGGPG